MVPCRLRSPKLHQQICLRFPLHYHFVRDQDCETFLRPIQPLHLAVYRKRLNLIHVRSAGSCTCADGTCALNAMIAS